MRNWEKLKIKLILLSMSDYKTVLPAMKIEEENEDSRNVKTCMEFLSSLVMIPTNKYKLAWEFISSIVMYISLNIDLYILAFALRPLVNDYINSLQRFGSVVALISIFLNLFTAIPAELNLELTK